MHLHWGGLVRHRLSNVMKTLLCNILCHHHQLLIIQLLQVYSFTGGEREDVKHTCIVSKKLPSSDISSTGECFLMKCVEPCTLKLQWHIPFCYSNEELSKVHHLITTMKIQ